MAGDWTEGLAWGRHVWCYCGMMLYPRQALVLRRNATALFSPLLLPTHPTDGSRAFSRVSLIYGVYPLITNVSRACGTTWQSIEYKVIQHQYHWLHKAKTERADLWSLTVATLPDGPEDDDVTHDFIILTKAKTLICSMEQNVEFQIALLDWLFKILHGLMALSEGLEELRILRYYPQGKDWLVLVLDAQLGQWLPAGAY